MAKKGNKIKFIVLVIIIILSILIMYLVFNKYKKIRHGSIKVDTVEKFNYYLRENINPIYKNKYKELKKILNEERIDELKYAQLVAELYLIDFYSLEDKSDNSEIGGLQFVHQSLKKKFYNSARNNDLYKYLQNKAFRTETVANVTSVESSVEKHNYNNKFHDLSGYEVKVELKYDKNLQYPITKTVYLIHEDSDKLAIVEIV